MDEKWIFATWMWSGPRSSDLPALQRLGRGFWEPIFFFLIFFWKKLVKSKVFHVHFCLFNVGFQGFLSIYFMDSLRTPKRIHHNLIQLLLEKTNSNSIT